MIDQLVSVYQLYRHLHVITREKVTNKNSNVTGITNAKDKKKE